MKKKLTFFLIIFANTAIIHAQWQLTGNSMLSSNFLGSTNAQPLTFKANNSRSGLLDYSSSKANTVFGYQALLSNSTGSENTAVGFKALNSNTSAIRNTASGSYTLFFNTTGAVNVGNGRNSLYANTTGQYNTGMGNYAIFNNINGNFNTATGDNSLFNNNSGTNNTANGPSALYFNLGSNNTGTGYQALYLNTNTSNLTGYGYQALYSNTSGIENTAIGAEVLSANTTGSYNTATGTEALHSNTTGSHNTAVGADVLPTSTTGSWNTAFGSLTLGVNNGRMNTAIGTYTALSNTTGERNTAVGYNTLYHNSNPTSGISLTAIGAHSLGYNKTGYSNIAIGDYALNSNTTGSNNTALGSNADGGVPNSGMFNCTLIGYATGWGNAGINKVCIGNTSVTSIKGQVSFSTYSDERFKMNIQPLLHGLDFINQLKPITYTVDIDRLNHFVYGSRTDTFFADAAMKKSIGTNSKITYSGFSAQQVEQVALDLNYNFSGVDKPENPDISPYGLRYSEFIVPLVKAVQELSLQRDSLQLDNQALQLQINALEQRVIALEIAYNKTLSLSLLITGNGVLKQNAPNPFNSNTIIRYHAPSNAKNAQIIITDMNGRNLKTIKIPNNGPGQINITAGSLPAGSYVYSLFIDGKKVDSKQMILTK